MINVRYHARKRPKPDQSPYESIDAGLHLSLDYQFYLLMLVDL